MGVITAIWVLACSGVVVLVLIALTVVIGTKAPLAQFEGGLARAIQLLLVLCGTIVSLLALWRCKRPGLRLAFSLITWAGCWVLAPSLRFGDCRIIPSRLPFGSPITGLALG